MVVPTFRVGDGVGPFPYFVGCPETGGFIVVFASLWQFCSASRPAPWPFLILEASTML